MERPAPAIVAPLKLAPGQGRLIQVGIRQVGIRQVGIRQVGIRQIGIRQGGGKIGIGSSGWQSSSQLSRSCKANAREIATGVTLGAIELARRKANACLRSSPL